ncbi:hypothetical protein U1Q18_031272 [Sarracenia purpurea var. burkii]
MGRRVRCSTARGGFAVTASRQRLSIAETEEQGRRGGARRRGATAQAERWSRVVARRRCTTTEAHEAGVQGARRWRRRRRWSKLAWLERRRGCRWAASRRRGRHGQMSDDDKRKKELQSHSVWL